MFGSGALARRFVAVLTGALVLSSPTFADDPPLLAGKGVTLFAGYHFGGSLTDETSGQSVDLREGGLFGASLDIPLDDSSEFQVFYGHQSTAFTPWPYPTTSDKLKVDYLHIGGTFFPEEMSRGVYVVGGLGATRMTPDADGFNPATNFSLNLGIGYLLPLSRNVGLRFEARGFATIINSRTAVFCSGGCVAKLTGSGVSQGAFLIGLSARLN